MMEQGNGQQANLLPWVASMPPRAASGSDSLAEWDDFSAVYESCLPAVLRYTLSRVHDPEIAEDLVGDIFERALRNWSTFRRKSAPLTWILGIAHHVIADHWRRSNGLQARLDVLPTELSLAEDVSPEELAQRSDDLRHMQKVIGRLSEQEQELLALRYAANLPLRDIASVLQIREGTARVRMHRALDRLRELLRDERR